MINVILLAQLGQVNALRWDCEGCTAPSMYPPSTTAYWYLELPTHSRNVNLHRSSFIYAASLNLLHSLQISSPNIKWKLSDKWSSICTNMAPLWSCILYIIHKNLSILSAATCGITEIYMRWNRNTITLWSKYSDIKRVDDMPTEKSAQRNFWQ